jgi:phenylpropionate dioxygenase-like ring-hydroxylating dioxygenase large terminal subunit
MRVQEQTNGALAATALDALVREDRVHRRLYTDPTIFEAEMRAIFGRGWVFVGHDSEVPYPGDYVTRYAGRQPLILTRAADDQVHVLYNRCMHRGALVCREAAGHARYFRCSYHGWTYANDGAVAGIPFRDAYPPDLDLRALGLMRAPRVTSYRGFVWASLAAEGEDLDTYLGPMRDYLDVVADRAPAGRIEARCGVIKYSYPGNWKLQCENFMDHYHALFTHESAFAQRFQADERDKLAQAARDAIEIHAYPGGHSAMYHPHATRAREATHADYVAALEASRGPARTAQLIAGDYNLHLYPNLIFHETSQSFRVIRPVAVDHTEVYVYPYRLVGAPEAFNDRKVRAVSWWASSAGTGQPDDLEIFVRVQEGLQAEGPEWVLIARGLHRERLGPAGERISAAGTDETALRGQYRRWRELLIRE